MVSHARVNPIPGQLSVAPDRRSRQRGRLEGCLQCASLAVAGSLASLGLATWFGPLAAPATAAPGFTTPFDPSTWVLVNTFPNQPLNGTAGVCNTETGFNSNLYSNGCFTNPDADFFSLYSSQVSGTPTVGYYDDNSTILTLVNGSAGSAYMVSFDWSFDWAGDVQSATIALSAGSLNISGNDVGLSYSMFADQGGSAVALLPPGATLNFTLATDNFSNRSTLSISNFTAAEVPAPLPLCGGSTAFLLSRRLRRRLRHAERFRRHSNAAAGTPGSVASPGRSSQQLDAIRRYADLIGSPLSERGGLHGPTAIPAPQVRDRATLAQRSQGTDPGQPCNDPVSLSNSR